MILSEKQQTISANPARFRVAVCGRRFGKTYLAMNEVAKVARYSDRRVFLVYPSYRQAKQVIWEPFKRRMQDLRWLEKYNESDLTLILRNGSRISLRGADNPDSLRGVGLDFVCMDEFAMIDEKAWTEVLRPTLSDRSGSALFISTPMGTSNWAYDLFQRGLDPTQTQWASFQYTTLDGGNVSEEEIEQARRDLSDRQFRQEYEATFETYSGRIYYNFDRTRNLRKFESEVPREILVFADFNVNPISAAIAVETGHGIHIIDEIVIYGSNTDELVQEIRNRYPTQSVRVYPDPAGVQRKTSAGGRTDITILENARFRVFYHRTHPAVRDRINAVNAALLSADETVSLWIDPRCRTVIECLEKQLYKTGTQIPDKDGGHDHMNDAIGYGIEYLKPVRREREPVAQPRAWGHQSAPGWRK